MPDFKDKEDPSYAEVSITSLNKKKTDYRPISCVTGPTRAKSAQSGLEGTALGQ